ncbi:MAG: hypothetical protein GQ574_26295 [Crocinitomix sp.]|nr:hypothetical protein [Crocinitomix sp.]
MKDGIVGYVNQHGKYAEVNSLSELMWKIDPSDKMAFEKIKAHPLNLVLIQERNEIGFLVLRTTSAIYVKENGFTIFSVRNIEIDITPNSVLIKFLKPRL